MTEVSNQSALELKLDEILNFHQVSEESEENSESLDVDVSELEVKAIKEANIDDLEAQTEQKLAKSKKTSTKRKSKQAKDSNVENQQSEELKTSNLSIFDEKTDESHQTNKIAKISENKRIKNYVNSKKSDVLLERISSVGDDPFSYLVLDKDDLNLPADELRKEQENFLNLLNIQPHRANGGESVQKKVAEKIIILFTMFAKHDNWNEVMRRTFKVLLRDGYIVGGVQGNLAKELFAKPYSKGTVLAQTGQMMQMLPLLKIVKKQGTKLVLNENSTIIEKVKKDYLQTLGL